MISTPSRSHAPKTSKAIFADMRRVALAMLCLVATVARADFTVTSEAVRPNRPIPSAQVLNGFGCHGENRSPDLHWTGAPAGTRSFAVTMYDPDAPTGSGFWHWLIVNIPSATTRIPAGAGQANLPAGSLQTRTDFGTVGYGGPCPPLGDAPHRYQFTVLALDIDKLPVDETSSGALVGFNLHFHTLAKATLTAKFGR